MNNNTHKNTKDIPVVDDFIKREQEYFKKGYKDGLQIAIMLGIVFCPIPALMTSASLNRFGVESLIVFLITIIIYFLCYYVARIRRKKRYTEHRNESTKIPISYHDYVHLKRLLEDKGPIITFKWSGYVSNSMSINTSSRYRENRIFIFVTSCGANEYSESDKDFIEKFLGYKKDDRVIWYSGRDHIPRWLSLQSMTIGINKISFDDRDGQKKYFGYEAYTPMLDIRSISVDEDKCTMHVNYDITRHIKF